MASRIDDFGNLVVKAETLSAPFDVGKVDVEGYEYDVLRGGSPLLIDPSRRPRVVFIELHVALLEARGADLHGLERLLPGYSLERLALLRGREHWLARAQNVT